MTPTELEEDLRRYREARARRVGGEDGWLSLVGRWLLERGPNRVDEGVATLEDDGAVRLRFDPGVDARGEDGAPTREHLWPASTTGARPYVFVGARRYELLRQGPKVAVRARDPNSPARAAFTGLRWFPPDPRWRVEARLVPYDPPRSIVLSTGLGALVPHRCPGALEMLLDGAPVRLDPVVEDDAPDRLFLLFRDATNARETYEAGRFLYAPLPDASGLVTLDFNKAFTPPCGLTEHAACPVAPPQNRLSLRVEAGEQRYLDHA